MTDRHLDPKYLPDGETEYGTEGASFSRNPELDLPVGTKVKFPFHGGRITIYGIIPDSSLSEVIEVFATGSNGASDARRGCRHRPGLTSVEAVTDAEWTAAIG